MSSIYSRLRAHVSHDGFILAAARGLEALGTGLWNASLARKLGLKKLKVRSQSFIAGIEHMTIGENFDAGRGLWLEAIASYGGQTFSPHIVIGNNVSCSFWCHIAAVHSITIGDNVMMGSKVLIIDHGHGSYGPAVHDSPDVPPAARQLSWGAVVIGKNVWIGDGVVVVPGSMIGAGAIIGANAVVSGVVPPNTIAVGTPARPIKVFDEASQRWVAAT